jgi:integrase
MAHIVNKANESSAHFECADVKLPAHEATLASHSKGETSMARKRFQRGSLLLRGRKKVWVAKWREDQIAFDGSIRRVQRREVLGSLQDYPTRRLAERALEDRLREINSLAYKPRPTATFAEFAASWQRDVLSQHKRSTQSGDRSRLSRHLIPELGRIAMKDIDRATVQAFVARKAKTLSGKSIKNLVALLREMWGAARADGYSQLDPFFGLRLPEIGLTNEPSFTLDEMKQIIETAEEPYKTFFWILAETGARCGEACGLPIKNIMLDALAICITQKVWHGKIETVKSKRGNRICEISPQLAEHLRGFLRTWRPNKLGLLFATKNGTPWDADVVRKRKLYPLLKTLGFERCGFHSFRHGNASAMDGENVPMATRLARLGHADIRTTLNYTHRTSEDGRQIAARFGELLTLGHVMMPAGNA